MTIKKAVLIGTLSAIAVGLIAFGIKTKSFSNKNTTPNANKRNALRVDAEDLYPVSTKWLWNKKNIGGANQTTTINYTSYSPVTSNTIKTSYTTIKKETYAWGANYYYEKTGPAWFYNNTMAYQYVNAPTSTDPKLTQLFIQNASRIIDFETQPTGDLYSALNANGQPAYNSDILIFTGYARYTQIDGTYQGNYYYNDTGINEIRKDSLTITKEDVQDGKFINEDGIIQLFLDAGISSLKINGTEYIGTEISTINITNQDIVIQTAGTNSGNTSTIFTINYFNTRPAITPQPYPDPGSQVVEVIDIMPMMFKILTMPFTFISQAFNVTLWEGTPYQFNFANFILSLIAIATLLFIIRLFTSGLSILGNYTAKHESSRLTRSETKLNKAKTKQIKMKNKQMKTKTKDK
ncbi:MAG: hypothetical protein J6X00_02495 [Clostridia bacterium]|nr:hypothetical protein [Clostridia bacterium]